MATDIGSLFSGLGDLYGLYRGTQTSGDLNNTIGNIMGSVNAGYSTQLQNLQNQIATGQAVSQGAYNTAADDVSRLNEGLYGNIDYLTGQQQALSDPNSAYMQMARQAIERKDAAAGRRSQWGAREVDLAAQLADRVAKYSPTFQSAINAAQQGISSNNTGLANIYNTMNMSTDRNNMALGNLLNGQQQAANTTNTTARQAANSATNSTTGLLNNLFGANGLGTQAIGALGNLFGNNSYGMTDWAGYSDPTWGYSGDYSYMPDYSGTMGLGNDYSMGNSVFGGGYNYGAGYDTSGLGSWADMY